MCQILYHRLQRRFSLIDEVFHFMLLHKSAYGHCTKTDLGKLGKHNQKTTAIYLAPMEEWVSTQTAESGLVETLLSQVIAMTDKRSGRCLAGRDSFVT